MDGLLLDGLLMDGLLLDGSLMDGMLMAELDKVGTFPFSVPLVGMWGLLFIIYFFSKLPLIVSRIYNIQLCSI